MQWVVLTGATVDVARARALEALGIDESDLDYEVLEEAGTTLFGLRRTDARIRARVRPTRPRPKLDRRGRRKMKARGRGRSRSDRSAGDEKRDAGGQDAGGQDPTGQDAGGQQAEPEDGRDRPPKARSRARRARDPEKSKTPSPSGDTGADMSDIAISEQEPTATEFVRGLIDAFGYEAEVSSSVDDEAVEIDVTGTDLGLLVGQRGNTLNAIQELVRTAVAQQHEGRLEGRLRVDVAGYRARRKEALMRFTEQQAERVKESGTSVALEPMSPPDRKVVHDTVNEIDGVHTESRGEDRRRHVVIHPDGA